MGRLVGQKVRHHTRHASVTTAPLAQRLEAIEYHQLVTLAKKYRWIPEHAIFNLIVTATELTREAITAIAKDLGIDQDIALTVVSKHLQKHADQLVKSMERAVEEGATGHR